MTANSPQARQLALHAVIVLLLGMVAGLCWGFAMADEAATASRQAAWRLAHIEGFANGVLMLGVALAYPLVQPQGWAEPLLRFGMIITGYSNMAATYYGGLFDGRGLLPGPASSVHDQVVYYLFMPGVVAVVVALAAMGWSLWRQRGAP